MGNPAAARHTLETQTIAKIKAAPRRRAHPMTRQSYLNHMMAWGYSYDAALVAFYDVCDVARLEMEAAAHDTHA